MNLSSAWIGDIETDDLIDKASLIHVFSFGYKKDLEWVIDSTNDYEAIKRFFLNPANVIAIHNGVRFDGPMIEKLLKIEIKATIIDTLALAWYIDCGRAWNEYNLEWYGEFFGSPKPPIDDWKNLSYEAYKERCTGDVKIMAKLWDSLLDKLRRVYDNDEDIVRVIKYLNFIMKCAYKQEEQKVEVDIEKVTENLAYFEGLKSVKVEQLKLSMPKVPVKRIVKKPKEMFKKAGDLSAAGKKWLEYNTDKEEIEIISGYTEPNPNSVQQKKAWLYSLGWKPQTFAYKREGREVRKIEQIMTDEKMLCPSVLKLKDKEPAIEVLDGISVLTHRIGVLKGFLENQKDGFITQGLIQLAVTLRWQHSRIVNLNKVTGKGDIKDGKWLRECLIAGKGKKIVQSDLSGIESRTSDHYTFPINPGLIKETQQPYYDPHTRTAVVAGLMTEEEETFFKWKKENKERTAQGLPELPVEVFGSLSSNFKVDDEKVLMNRLKLARHKAKTCNYSSLYLVGAATLSRTLNISKSEAQKLIDSYWKINYGVLEVTKTFDVKEVDDQMWILNPVSRFRHHLRNKKDSFSTTNQSTAVYVFNMWLYNISQQGLWPIMQSHDDLVVRCDEADAEKVKGVINKAMDKLNKQLKLNVPISCEVQVGNKLSETH